MSCHAMRVFHQFPETSVELVPQFSEAKMSLVNHCDSCTWAPQVMNNGFKRIVSRYFQSAVCAGDL